MINIENKSNCCGCGACQSNCPKDAIELLYDEEGFYYPKVDYNKCIGCNHCNKVCPVENISDGCQRSQTSKLYYVQNKNVDIRKNSTSGGAFTAIADYVLENNGFVVGVGFDENLRIVHKVVDNADDVMEFRGSKYVQSSMKDIFELIWIKLKTKKIVFFTGTPCQVRAIKLVFPNQKNLITMDIMCLGVSSPRLYENWVNYIVQKYKKKIKMIEFRNKDFGYSVSNVKITFDDNSYIDQRYDSKAYIKTFFDYYNVRPSCYECVFRELHRVSDFTVGDLVGDVKSAEIKNDDTGVSRLWVHTEIGHQIFNSIRGDLAYELVQTDCDSIIGGPKKQITSPTKRAQFFSDSLELCYEDWIRKWEPNTLKSSFMSIVRVLLKDSSMGKKIFRWVRGCQAKKFNKDVRKNQIHE